MIWDPVCLLFPVKSPVIGGPGYTLLTSHNLDPSSLITWPALPTSDLVSTYVRSDPVTRGQLQVQVWMPPRHIWGPVTYTTFKGGLGQCSQLMFVSTDLTTELVMQYRETPSSKKSEIRLTDWTHCLHVERLAFHFHVMLTGWSSQTAGDSNASHAHIKQGCSGAPSRDSQFFTTTEIGLKTTCRQSYWHHTIIHHSFHVCICRMCHIVPPFFKHTGTLWFLIPKQLRKSIAVYQWQSYRLYIHCVVWFRQKICLVRSGKGIILIRI